MNVSAGTLISTEGTVTDNGGNNWTIAGITAGNDITLTVNDPAIPCSETLAVSAPDCSCPTVNPPTVVRGNQQYCSGGTVPTMEVSIGANETVDWYTVSTGGIPVATATTSFTPLDGSLADGANVFYAETRNTIDGCTGFIRTDITISRLTAPLAPTANSPVEYCLNDTAVPLSAVGNGLLWHTTASGGTGDPIPPTPDTSVAGITPYWVSQTLSGCGESPRLEISVVVYAPPVVSASASAVSIDRGDSVILQGSGALTYTWDNAATDGEPVFPLATTTFTVTGTDINGCANTAQVTVTVTPTNVCPIIFFNEFTPNQDGLNDVLYIECIETYPNNSLQIYNRWGKLVYERSPYDNSWEGTSMVEAPTGTENILPSGTYFYVLDLGEPDTNPRSGWLYISR